MQIKKSERSKRGIVASCVNMLILLFGVHRFLLSSIVSGENTPEAVVKYIRELFHQHRPCHKQVYTHVSCATDVMMMRELLSKVIDIVTEINLRKSAAAF